MSTSNWEEGKIVIPSKDWASTKKSIRDAYNRFVEDEFKAARAWYDRFKGKKQPEYNQEGSANYEAGQDRFYCLFVHATKKNDRGWSVRLDTPRAPRRADYPLANNRTTSFDVYGEEFGFGFDNDKRAVCWSVPENNRACEDARKHILSRELFRILGSIKYTRGTGGKIIGNDENNQDSKYEDGGSNYVNDEYGPNVKLPVKIPYYMAFRR